MACRLRAKETGALSQIYGGRWHKFHRRYLREDELGERPLDVAIWDVSSLQMDFIEDWHSKVSLCVAGRRGGKSEASARKGGIFGLLRPGSAGQWVSPTYDKTRILWRYLMRVLPAHWVADVNLAERWILLENGHRFQFLSAYKADSLIGEGVSWMAFDESQSITDQAIDLAFPALSDGGYDWQVWHTGTIRGGMFRQRMRRYEENGGRIYRLPTSQNPFIAHGEGSAMEAAKAIMDPHRYAREILAQDAAEEGLVYYRFDRDKHVRPIMDMLRSGEAKDVSRSFTQRQLGFASDHVVGIDFGVGRQFATVYRCVEVGRRTCLHAIDEITLWRDASIDELCNQLISRGYGGASAFPDSTGKMVAYRLQERGFQVYMSRQNPLMEARIDMMNSLMESCSGIVRYYVDPKCVNLIEGFEGQEMKDGRPDKKSNHDHMPDSAGYPAWWLFRDELGETQLTEHQVAA